LSEAGIAVLDRFRDPDALITEVSRRYREIYNSRKTARQRLGGRLSSPPWWT
jgi:hypothetical protein